MQRQGPELVASFADVNRMAILQLLSPRHTNISPEATMEMLTYIASCVIECCSVLLGAQELLSGYRRF
jgi:hypothetical protein